MKELVIENQSHIDAEIFENSDLEKLTISNCTFSLPKEIALLNGLKQLKLINNTIDKLPVQLFDLQNTFVFFENNNPAFIQEAGLIYFDFQWKKISKAQASIYLSLLQNDIQDIPKDDLKTVIQALDYRVETVRKGAQALLNDWFPLDEIPQNALVSILGRFTVLSLNDISHRLDTLSINYQTKLSAKTTHVVLCNEPALKNVDISQNIITTERNFLAWLDKVDVRFLAKKTNENEDALDNVSEMLLGDDPEHIELALQMMKVHGVSKELLGDLFIFFNGNKHEKFFRRAKSLFKKSAPKDLIDFLDSNTTRYGGAYEINTNSTEFYSFLKESNCMDRIQIAFALNKRMYFKIAKEEKNSQEALGKMIKDKVLDISVLDKIPEEIKTLEGYTTLICKSSQLQIKHFPDWFSELPIQRLDLYGQDVKLPARFSEFRYLTHLCLPTSEESFPLVITKIRTLEVLEMSATQFALVPEEISQLTNLRKVVVYREWEDNFDQVLIQKKPFFPANCEIKKKERR